jgi:hypothetical protein
MTSAEILKRKLWLAIEKLPENKLREALDFISQLLSQKSQARAELQPSGQKLDPTQDPILRFIGGVAHGSLAQAIDEELYSA